MCAVFGLPIRARIGSTASVAATALAVGAVVGRGSVARRATAVKKKGVRVVEGKDATWDGVTVEPGRMRILM